jgi:iron(III) transport system ATP-binding protein
MVFQSYAIWPHLSVFANVAFPLVSGRRRFSRQEVREKTMQALRLVQLDHLADRPAPFLSGGQQQRVALARALVAEPTVLLLDEPLSNLDAKLRAEMRFELKNLVKSLGVTTLYVTHDQMEALTMSDKVAVMQGGVRRRGHPQRTVPAPALGLYGHLPG